MSSFLDPLGMSHAAMHGYSSPRESSGHAPAGLYIGDIDVSAIPGSPAIDYAGRSVIAPLSHYLLIMKALTSHRIIREETLQQMIKDDVYMGLPTVNPGANPGRPPTSEARPIALPE